MPNSGYTNSPETCLGGAYCAELDDETKKFITEQFSREFGTIRVLIATVAYGIGVDNKDIRMVIHWKEPKKLGSLLLGDRKGWTRRRACNCNSKGDSNSVLFTIVILVMA